MLAVFLVFSEAARRAMAGKQPQTIAPVRQSDILFYRYVPMALSILPISAYFVFRSYDYTLAEALLPTCALLIAAGIPFTRMLAAIAGCYRALAIIPIGLLLAVTFYAILVLGRPGAPYSFLLHECRDHGRCTYSALSEQLSTKIHARDLLEPVGNHLSDRWIDIIKPTNLVADATALVERYGQGTSNVSVLLGNSIANELVLLYTNKWQHFPISFTYTDQLASSIERSIVIAPVTLQIGDLILVAPQNMLSAMEVKLWQRIRREYTLCRLTKGNVSLYRVCT